MAANPDVRRHSPPVFLIDERGTTYRVIARSEHDGGLQDLRVESIRDARALGARIARRFRLTKRELEIALLLAGRASNHEIAERLGISSHTARHHTERVLTKLVVRSRSHVRFALNTAIVEHHDAPINQSPGDNGADDGPRS